MREIHNFFWLAEQTLQVLLFLWPVSCGLLVFITITSVRRFPFTPSEFRTKYLTVFSPFILSILLLVVGDLLAYNRETYEAPMLGVILTNFVFWLHVPVSFAVIYSLKGHRWFAASVELLAFWTGMAAVFIAGMAVTGKWL